MKEGLARGDGQGVRILVADDDAGVRYTLLEILRSAGFDPVEAEDGHAALKRFEEGQFPLVITDLRMPNQDGMEVLRRIVARAPGTRVIFITAHGSERHAVEAMKAGAYDYFKKPFETEELLAVVRRAAEAARLTQENERLQSELQLSRTMVFASEAMSRLAVLVGRVAPREVTVLITGESGVGKERVAEALVRASPRARRPFVRFNCAALTAQLAEAELFGHSRGAFTGAVRARLGLFGEADGGTLLLDEVGELDPSTQGKLLRVLQEGEVRPVGEDRPRRVDVRVLASTHRELKQLVQSGQFREDLYYRLDVVNLRVPPLRERPEDVPVLARHFFERAAERFGTGPLHLPDELWSRIAGYPWPGNVRELENAIENLVALSADGQVDLSLLPGGPPAVAGETAASPLRARVEGYERGLVLEALRASGGNRSEAARTLGISRVTLHDKLKKYGLVGGEDSES